MTYQAKYRQNERLLDAYVGFLDECTNFQPKLCLSEEIGRLATQNKQIEKMEFATTKTDISIYELKIPACL